MSPYCARESPRNPRYDRNANGLDRILMLLMRILARSTSSPYSDTLIEEECEESPSESEWPLFAHLRLGTPEKVDTAGIRDGAVQVVRTIPEPKRTVARLSKKRSRQYFLDLGQADFTHTTCRTCGLVYARGLESDEKIHNSFHRSQLKGISFKVCSHAS